MIGSSNIREVQKKDRFYLRYHMTVERAMELNRIIYGDSRTKDGKQFKFEHPLRVAGLTQEIQTQGYDEYHMCWLIGILHDSKEDNPVEYGSNIDDVLQDLLTDEAAKTKKYIDQLSSDKSLSKGQQKREQVKKIDQMDLIPCWIKIFDKYDNCLRYKQDSCGKSAQELQGYYAVAYLCYYKAIMKYPQIAKNLQKYIKELYAQIEKDLNGIKNIRKIAQKYYAME